MTAKSLRALLELIPDYTEIIIRDEYKDYFRYVYATDYGAVEIDDPIIKNLPELEGKLVFVII